VRRVATTGTGELDDFRASHSRRLSRKARLLASFRDRPSVSVQRMGRQAVSPRAELSGPGSRHVAVTGAAGVVVECWCGMVERMNRRTLDRFTRDIWRRFDHRDLEPLKWAILRRRRVLAMQLRR
jgi:hypothetical protein